MSILKEKQNKPLTTTFVIGYQNWLEFYHKDIEYLVEYPPQGFYEHKSVTIGMLLSKSFYVKHHWFYVYHHELLHHILRTLEGEEASHGLDSIRQYMITNNLPNPLENILPLKEMNVKSLMHVNDVDLSLALVVGEDSVAKLIFQKLVNAYGVSEIKWNERDDCRNYLFRYLHVCISEKSKITEKVLSYIEQYNVECVIVHSNQDRDLITDLNSRMNIPLFYAPLKYPKGTDNNLYGDNLHFDFTDSMTAQSEFFRGEPKEHLEGAGFQTEWGNPWTNSRKRVLQCALPTYARQLVT